MNSSPIVSSPLRFLSNIISDNSAESRAHPSAERDVWELGVWDPHPLSIRLFCLFSPGHVLVYWLFLPTAATDTRPSVTIVTTIFLAALLTVQMSFLSSSFSQQVKDTTLVHKEVLHEYDTKFVHPRTLPLMRSVATQFSADMAVQTQTDEKYNTVEEDTPGIPRQGFKISPNPNYIKHIDPEGVLQRQRPTGRLSISSPSVPSVMQHSSKLQTPSNIPDASSPLSQLNSAVRQPQFRSTSMTGDGGSLGVYSHASSPLRKSASSNFDQRRIYRGDESSIRDRPHSPGKRSSSPLKRSSVPAGMSSATPQRFGHLANHSVRRESGRF